METSISTKPKMVPPPCASLKASPVRHVEAGLVLPDCERHVVVLLVGVGGLGGTSHALHAAHEREEAESIEVGEAALALGPALLECGALAGLEPEAVRSDISFALELAIGEDRGAHLAHDVCVRAGRGERERRGNATDRARIARRAITGGTRLRRRRTRRTW